MRVFIGFPKEESAQGSDWPSIGWRLDRMAIRSDGHSIGWPFDPSVRRVEFCRFDSRVERCDAFRASDAIELPISYTNNLTTISNIQSL